MKDIIIDFGTRQIINGKIEAIQGDNTTKKIKILLKENSSPYNLVSKSVMLTMKKNSSNSYVNKGDFLTLKVTNPTNGEVELPIDKNFTKEKGRYQLQLSILNEVEFEENSILFEAIIHSNLKEEISGTLVESIIFKEIKQTLQAVKDIAKNEQARQEYIENTVKPEVAKINDFDSRVTEIANQIEIDYWNLATNAEVLEQWYIDASNGEGKRLISFFSVVLNVKENTAYKYEHTSKKTDNIGTNMRARSVAFYNEDGIFISGTSYPNFSILTPKGCTKMRICFIYLNQETKEKGEYYIALKQRDKRDIVYIKNLKYKENNIEIRKPSFSFTFDDGNATDLQLKNVFDEYGFKCGFALLGNSSITTKKDTYLQFQNEGFEILSHSIDSVAMQSGTETIEVIENKFKESKKVLEDNGFIVNGWVTPSTWLNNKYLNALKKYYCYGLGHLDTNSTDVIHTVKSKDIRQLERWSLQNNTLEQTKAKIDECVTKNAFLCFYAHKFPSEDNFTEVNLREILRYLKEKTEENEIVVDTPYKCINSYFKIRQYDLL